MKILVRNVGYYDSEQNLIKHLSFSSYKKQRSREVLLLKLIILNLLDDRINVLLD